MTFPAEYPEYDDDKLFRLSEYLDDGLGEAARSQLERELAQDPGLRAELEALRRLEALARDHTAPVPELDWERFTGQCRQRRMAYESARRRRRVWRVFTPLAAAAVLALSVTTALWTTGRLGHPPAGGGLAAGGERVVIVRITRTELDRVTSAVAWAGVSRDLPDDAEVTVGPVPTGVMLLAATAAEPEAMDLYDRQDDDIETLF